MSFPDSSGYGLLVPTGAPWSAGLDDRRIGRWFVQELEWLAGVVAAGGAVLGICFGAKALARALGIDPADLLAEADRQADAARQRAVALVAAYLAKVLPG